MTILSVITEMKSRGIAVDLGAENTGPGGAYEWLIGYHDKLDWHLRSKLKGYFITSGVALFGNEKVAFVSLHEDTFDLDNSNDTTAPTPENCIYCLKVIEGSTSFIALRLSQEVSQ